MKNVHIFKKSKAFTLIELLVVITIIGILAAFIVATFTSAQQQARDAKRKADLDALKKALELAKSNSIGSRYFPACAGIPCTTTDLTLVAPGYIKDRPQDPKNATVEYPYLTAIAGCTANCTDYRLRAGLENTNDPQIAASQQKCTIATTGDYASLAADVAATPWIDYALTDTRPTYAVCPD